MPRIDLWTGLMIVRVCLGAIMFLGIVAVTGAPRDRLTVAERPGIPDPPTTAEAPESMTSPPVGADSSTAGRNPFAPWSSADPGRFDPIRFASEQTVGVEDPTARPRRGPVPRIVLQGLVLGPDPRAILSGVPGSGRALVMEPGDESGGLTMISVEPSGARVRWADSTWIVGRTDGAGG